MEHPHKNVDLQISKKYYRTLESVITLFSILLVVSFFCELTFNKSFTELLINSIKLRAIVKNFLAMVNADAVLKITDSTKLYIIVRHLLAVINTDAVLKITEAIGLSSIPIACIYASLDKIELGFSYRELLKHLFPCYNWFAMIHLVSVLCCMWLATVKLLESSILALIIILVGCLLQWDILDNILLSTEKRRKIALHYWRNLVEQNENEGIDYLQFVVLRMADSISISTDKSYKEVLKTFSTIACEFINIWDTRYKETQKNNWELICKIENMWKHLLAGKDKHEQFLFSAEVLKQCIEDSNYDLVCAGYVICLCREKIMDSPYKEECGENLLQLALNTIAQMVEREFPALDSPTRINLETVFTLFIWMHFIYGNITLNEDLLKLSPKKADNNETRLKLIAQAIVDGDPKGYFVLVKDQIYRPDKDPDNK